MTTIDPKLLEVIDKKIKEVVSKSIEKVQIALLRENFLTREEFLDAIERIDKRFEALQKQMDERFEASQKQTNERFEALQKQIDKRFNKVDERFEASQKQTNERFEALQKQIDKRFNRVYERFDDMDFDQGKVVEGIAYSMILREFRNRGHDLKLKIRQHFIDENHEVFPDTTDVETDVFHIKPNIICEATYKLTDLDKVRNFIKKFSFIEKLYKESFERFLLCAKIKDSIKGEIKELTKQYNIELIIIAEN